MFDKRIGDLKEQMGKEKLDAVFLSSVSTITYLTGYANFSKDEREAYLIIGKDFQYLITDGRYTEAIKREVPHFTLFERSVDSKTEDLLKKLKTKIKKLGIEEDNLTVAEHRVIKKLFKSTQHFEVAFLRSIKIADEIEKISKACKIGDLAFDYILKQIKEGVTEEQIAYELEKFIRESGAELAFPAIVAFGANSSIPHHHTGSTKLRSGDFVLLDFGVKVDGFCSDMTRTIVFDKSSDQQIKMHRVVLEAQQKASDYINEQIKRGEKIKASAVDKVARDLIKSKGYPDIPHSLGHGIGLDVHEHPFLSVKSKEELKEGMVFSIEPGIYIENFGGVRIEDLYVLEKLGLRQITTSPKK